jgi:hypothetical protein
MGKIYEELDERTRAFIEAQHVFFVATAPAALDGRINLSPKGLDALRVLGPREIAYLDLVGSGAETIAHARENGRITLMFCAFEGPPKIVRCYGRASVCEAGSAEFAELAPAFARLSGARSIVRVALERVADSCGYGVPILAYQRDRTQLTDYAERSGEDGLRGYQREHNRRSIDGLPALRWTETE